jgi:hypothetical protein
MNKNYFSTCLLATVALFSAISPVSAQQLLGTASEFSVLGGTAVTCTSGSVVGNVGISPGIAAAYTNTGCAIAGESPPASDAAAALARADFLNANVVLQSAACTEMLSGSLAALNLEPGVYCVDAVTKTGTLTLTGPADGVWIFQIAGALTGTNFSVVLDGGAQSSNVFWAPSAGVTMTTSVLQGAILAGDTTSGSITFTGGSLVGRALASVAVTMTTASVITQ